MNAPALEQRLHAAFDRHAINPDDLAPINDICDTLIALRLEEELLPWADRALALRPHDIHFVSMRTTALDLLGRHAEAVETWLNEAALPWPPGFHPLRLGYSLMMTGEIERAIAHVEQARLDASAACSPLAVQATHLLGEILLRKGDGRGFTHWLARNDDPYSAGNFAPAGVPLWRGETDLRGKRVLVTHQLGYGDNFLLGASLADWLAAGASIMLTCDPEIHALMQASLPDCLVVPAKRPLKIAESLPNAVQPLVDQFAPDLHATLMHLPLLKAASSASGYRFRAYMRAPRKQQGTASGWARQLREQHPGKKLVGIFWDCLQRHQFHLGSKMRCWAARRSLPLPHVNQLVAHPDIARGAHFVTLHHPGVEANAGMPAGNVSRYLPGIRHFDDTAACIEQLDAVIAVDSSIANLAAMMGKPTCVPLNTFGEWRWGHQGSTTPWMHRVTTIRQAHEGQWGPVVQDLARWVGASFSKF